LSATIARKVVKLLQRSGEPGKGGSVRLLLIPSPNGKAWYLYYEQYPGVAYGLSVAASLDGPWFQPAGNQKPDWDKYYVPPKVRHGGMLTITRRQYDALVAAFGKTAAP
jgi:hypothetical protein